MDIYLTEVGNSKSSLRFPAIPEKISVTDNTKYRTYDLISGKTSKLPFGSECEEISWNGTFFGETRKKQRFIRLWKDPKSCEKQLKAWMKQKKVLKLLVTETSINIDVTISKFSIDAEGGFGDLSYSIEFIQYSELKIYTMKELGKGSTKKKKTTSRPSSTKKGGTYTVKKGDNLWSIAQKKLGKGSRWSEIYKLNKKVIEATAKKHKFKSSSNGHWIFPGTKLTLPAK